MNIIKKTLAGLLVVFLAFGQVTVIPGDWVQGFSSLTTAGSNVYVTGLGTIGQDTSFTRSAAGRYTLYDATPTTGVTTLTVRAGEAQSTTNLQEWSDNSGSVISSVAYNGVLTVPGAIVGSGGYVLFGSRAVIASPSANNISVKDSANSTTYWTLGAGGIQCGSGDGNSAACDVGTTGARVRNVNAAGTGTFAGNITSSGGGTLTGGILSFNGSGSNIRDTADGRILVMNAAGNNFDRLQFGGTTNLFPALKRFGNAVAVRAADDTISTFATLTACSASGEGALASISDSATAVWGLVVTGGGSNHILAYCNGTDWTVAAK